MWWCNSIVSSGEMNEGEEGGTLAWTDPGRSEPFLALWPTHCPLGRPSTYFGTFGFGESGRWHPYRSQWERAKKIKEKHSFTGKFSALQNANVTHLAEIPHNVEKSDNNPMYVHFKYLMPCTMCHWGGDKWCSHHFVFGRDVSKMKPRRGGQTIKKSDWTMGQRQRPGAGGSPI